jgi:uncharacterized repeat protein (TIGR01451 family)
MNFPCAPPGMALFAWLGIWAALPHCGFEQRLLGPTIPTADVCAPSLPPPPPPADLAHAPDPPTPIVALRVRVPALAPSGQELHYHLCVENCSPAAAHHVVVRNPLPANARFVRASPQPSRKGPELQWHLGTMHGGERRVIVLILAPTNDEDVKNCTRVQFEHGQCVTTRLSRLGQEPGLVQPGKVVPVPKGEPKLKLEMTGPKQQYLNLPATYHLTLRNLGTGPAANAMVTASLPAKMTFLRAGEGGKAAANQVAWLLGTLEAGTSRTVELVLRAQAEGEFCVKGGALADPNLRAEAEVCTLFRGMSALLLEVIDRQDPVEVGGETSYPIVIVNQGNTPVTNLQIKAYLPEVMSLVKAKGPSDNRLGDRAPKGYQMLLFDPLPSLAVGAKAEYEVFVKGLKPADARFRVELTADQLKAGGAVLEEESTTIYADNAASRPMPLQSRPPRKN